MDKYQRITKELGFNRVKLDEPLSNHTYIKVGGPADFLYSPINKKELTHVVKLCRELEIPFTILGLGANVLVSDKGVRGLTIINQAANFKFLANGFLEAESGVNVSILIKETTDRGFTGLERMIRVPSSVGGAVYMNAGHTAKKEFFGELVVSVEVLNKNNEIKKVPHQDAEFSYRSSRFHRTGEIILSALLHLQKARQEEIEEKMREIITHKSQIQAQPSGPSVGSTFRNPPNDYAGRLLDQAGLKGRTVGNAKVSEKHANFIINTGDATATDIKNLIELMRSEVKSKFGTDLEEEVRYIGEW